MKQLLIATGNMHKVQEIGEILNPIELEFLTTKQVSLKGDGVAEPVEDGTTYEANAIIKARFWADRTSHWTLSDDSGLEVDAMDGRPGLYSARYGDGQDPIGKLLGELDGLEAEKRTARFRAVVCLCSPQGECITREGSIEGHIAFSRKGDGGFGYDPVFIPVEKAPLHFSEIPAAEKNTISHRARALQQIKPELLRLLIF